MWRRGRYSKEQKNAMTGGELERGRCARWTGTNEDPVVTGGGLGAGRKLVGMEREHCGRDDAI